MKTARTEQLIDAEGRSVYLRSQPFARRMLARLANRAMPAGLSVLIGREWADWETQTWAALNGVAVGRDADTLRIPALPGESLRSFLRHATTLPPVLEAARAAAEALHCAHRVSVRWPNGTSHPFSHADATTDNVVYDPATLHAAWIDFETLHDPARPDTWRQADDLRAVMVSAACDVQPPFVVPLIESMADVFADTELLPELLHLLRDPPDLYRLAQSGATEPIRRSRLMLIKETLVAHV